MSIKNVLEDLVLSRTPGPRSSFSVLDVLKVFELIAETGSIGRGKISEKTGLGEGVTRTLVRRLTDVKIISSSREGCKFTDKGLKIWENIDSSMPQKIELETSEITVGTHNVAVLIKDQGGKISKGLEQRDAAIMAGGKGALTLILKGGKVVLPSISSDLAKDYPKTFKQLDRAMNLEENDVVIISSADTLKEAEYGAMAAAWTLF